MFIDYVGGTKSYQIQNQKSVEIQKNELSENKNKLKAKVKKTQLKLVGGTVPC